MVKKNPANKDLGSEGLQSSAPSASDFGVIEKINNCPRVPSLESINQTLGALVNSENSFMAQIAEVISRDPSLTSRLLNLVNSVFFGLSYNQPVKSIEEAAFYVGLRQLEELITSTPVIEDFEDQFADIDINWKQFWRHSIGTAILTREVLASANVTWEDESDYIAGLVHNIGKIVMALAFVDEFKFIAKKSVDTTFDVCRLEQSVLCWDHARIGAYYLWQYHLAPEVIESVQYHNDPKGAQQFPELAAAVQIADHMARSAGIDSIEKTAYVMPDSWPELDGWAILFKDEDEEAQKDRINSLILTRDRIATTLKGMV